MHDSGHLYWSAMSSLLPPSHSSDHTRNSRVDNQNEMCSVGAKINISLREKINKLAYAGGGGAATAQQAWHDL